VAEYLVELLPEEILEAINHDNHSSTLLLFAAELPQ